MKQELETYARIIKVRNFLKRINQLSWNLNQFERRYPFDQVESEDFISMEQAYNEFMEDILKIVKEYEMNKYEKPSQS